MLQIIRGKLVIFLITLVYLLFTLGLITIQILTSYFMDIKHQRALRYIFLKNIIYKIINDQKISRGNGHFISIMVNNYRTHCGVVDINLNFFNDILYSVRLKNISKLENMEFCATKQRVYFSDKNKKASYKIINYGDYYDVDYYDNNLKNEVFDWIGKWS